MGVIIPNWEEYTGGGMLTKTAILSPYQQTTKDADETYEFGGFPGAKVDQITADKITTGVLTAVATMGDSSSGFIQINGEDVQILMNDGSNDRVLLEP